jgi:hypothetical protein
MGRKQISIATEGEAFTGRVVTSGDDDEQYKCAVTATEFIQAFTEDMIYLLLYNDGPNGVHVDTDETVTTNSFLIPAKAQLSLGAPYSSIHMICAAGQTATVYLWGVR